MADRADPAPPLAGWLEQRIAAAPPALRDRVRVLALEFPYGGDRARHLGDAARRTLETVTAHPGDRSIALDLLAADALITLALLAQAEVAPEHLGDFASGLLALLAPGA